MILLSNTDEQTIQPGQSINFNQVILRSNDGGCGRNTRSNIVRLRSNGLYEVHFAGNIGGLTAATPVRLAIALDGQTLPETTMISTPAAVGDFNNVATATLIRNCTCDNSVVTVTNTGTEPVVVDANTSFFVKRVG